MQTLSLLSVSQARLSQPSQKTDLLRYRGVPYQGCVTATKVMPWTQPLSYRGIPYRLPSIQVVAMQNSLQSLRYRGIAYRVL